MFEGKPGAAATAIVSISLIKSDPPSPYQTPLQAYQSPHLCGTEPGAAATAIVSEPFCPLPGCAAPSAPCEMGPECKAVTGPGVEAAPQRWAEAWPGGSAVGQLGGWAVGLAYGKTGLVWHGQVPCGNFNCPT